MKTERRHELGHNELAQKLKDLVAGIKKYGNYITLGIFLIALVVLIIVYATNRAANNRAKVQNDFELAMLAVDPQEKMVQLKGVAAQDTDKRVAAMANIALGNEYLSRYIASAGKGSDADRKEYLTQANESYQKVIANYVNFPDQAAQAHFGLARLAEDRGDLDAAAAEYAKAMSTAQTDNPIIKIAEIAKNNVAQIKSPVKMATTAPATQPTTGPVALPVPTPASTPASVEAPAPASAPAALPATTTPAAK